MVALIGNEILYVIGVQNGGYSAETEQTTTGQIAALSGGIAAGVITPIDSGTTYITKLTDTFVRWKSITSGDKTTYVTTNGMVDGQVIIIKDYGAYDFSQTVRALEVGVTIEYQPTYTFDPANGASINLKYEADENNLVVW